MPSQNDTKPLPRSWLTARTAGVLAHLSSLPGDFGIGNMGAHARRFIDFLAESGFKHWQICPLGPTSYGDSPYQSFSSFAGNPYFIDLQELVQFKLLEQEEIDPLQQLPREHVDYAGLYEKFWTVLAKAYDRFAHLPDQSLEGFGSLSDFLLKNRNWIVPYADFMALKSRFGERPWINWPKEARGWHEDVRNNMTNGTKLEAERQEFYQYLFFGQWMRLKAYANSHGISIIGDIPIFVALDSADTWQNKCVFKLDEEGHPTAVAGVPPDYFSEFGQHWGNPLYNWDFLKRTGFSWWIERLRSTFELYDIVRLDHFRGFDTYWEIPASAPDARTGEWKAGPGIEFFRAVQKAIPHAKIIAEDLGYISQGVFDLRKEAGLPGMKIIQFGYGHDDNNVNLPHFYPKDSVAYTGTHDNDTIRGWLESLPEDRLAQIETYFNLNGDRSAWPFIRATLASVSQLAVIPMQDLLNLPSSARMNRPGIPAGNWQWRFSDSELSQLENNRVSDIKNLILLYNRDGDPRQRDYSASPVDAENPVKTSQAAVDFPTHTPVYS